MSKYSLLSPVLALSIVSCGFADRLNRRAATPDGDLVARLGELGPLDTRLCARLSVASAPKGCSRPDTGAFTGVLADRRDDFARIAAAATIAAQAAAVLRDGLSLDAMHAAALLDITVADTVGKSLDRSISYLEMLTRLAPDSPSPWVDLSAARLAAGAGRSDAKELLLALDAASRAIAIDEHSASGSYNRAMSLDLLGIDGEAAKEWRRYLVRDSTSSWATRARERLAANESVTVTSVPDVAASSETLVAFARRAPFEARGFTWQHLLSEWGEATIANDSARADQRLASAAMIAQALSMKFGDSSITYAVQAIARVKGQERTALAKAHVRYAWALDRTRANDHRNADSGFIDVVRQATVSPSLRAMAAYGHANATVYSGALNDGIALAERILDRVDATREPSLAGRAKWLIGIARLRLVQNDAGLVAMRQAREALSRAGEQENAVASIGVEAELQFRLGDYRAGYAKAIHALRGLRFFPRSTWRHNMLYVLAREATLLGADYAASALEDEDFASELAAGRPISVAEARLARARTLWASARRSEARAAIDTVSRLITSLPYVDAHSQLKAELDLTLASGPLQTEPRRAFALVDSVVRFYEPSNNGSKLLPALVARARAALVLGLDTVVEQDLRRASTIYAAQRRSIAPLPQRTALLTSVRTVFDGLIMLRVAQARTNDALDVLEQSRRTFVSSASPVHTTARSAMGLAQGIVIEYALIGDTLLSWVVDGTRTSFSRTRVNRVEFGAAVERATVGLELRVPENVVRGDLGALYRWLVLPIEKYLGSEMRGLIVVGDQEIDRVPFAALFDEPRQRYLIESRPIRWSANLMEARAQADSLGLPRAAVFVGDPMAGDARSAGLGALEFSSAEIRSSADRYRGSQVLSGVTADSAAVVNAMQKADMFHFAGHAIFDDAQPGRSELVLPPHSLSADAIATLDLHRLHLAVLSACETMRTTDRRSGGFAGLTDAFLAAGANGVIGTLWRIDDGFTATLMKEFHTAYSRSGNATTSLREAQLSLLRSPHTELRTPASWAGVRYFGH